MRPVIIRNFLHPARIQADADDHFRRFMIDGARLDSARVVLTSGALEAATFDRPVDPRRMVGTMPPMPTLPTEKTP
ncbi:MAG TPA: hypothetical protein VJY39_12960 [Acidisphaera sp.]|nr:hypothetical protein [Acidisphaera sp.]